MFTTLFTIAALGFYSAGADGGDALEQGSPSRASLEKGIERRLALPSLQAGATYALEASLLSGDLADGEEVRVSLTGIGAAPLEKTLHAGDPSLYLPFRQREAGPAGLSLRRNSAGSERAIPAMVRLVRLASPVDAASFEAEPNDRPAEANPLIIGRTVEGSADDVEYLDHQEEGKRGLDWFRFEISGEPDPCLVIFELDYLDRDVSGNLRVYTEEPGGSGVVPYLEGKDPMEVVHDRERERYSKSISRVFKKGFYFLEVNANHPRYLLRSHRYPVPPYTDPHLAVEVGARYIMDVGDAWFAQVPRAGDIYRRVQNQHETSLRCTACHPAVFSTESNLVAHRNGYPIGPKSNFRYVVERIYNSITPFYGPDGLWWQRYIAIPLQSQGKQGGILIDFEKQILGRETSIPARFGPLLRAAWGWRKDLPADEQNGVVPADSKFGFAWRDWRVLRDIHRRTGDESYARAADRIREIFTAPESEKRIEDLQDRLHLLQGLVLMGPEEHRERIGRLSGEILALQNGEGGWHEEGKPAGAGAEYTTGQAVYTLLQTGIPASDPRIEKALRWLLSRQKPFGGWFQTDTHENFRTPMRETRYAVMALASGYPKGPPLNGMGNLDGGEARPPRANGTVAEILADLENLWDVPDKRRRYEIACSILPFLTRPEVPVRAAAAEALGRIGGPGVNELLPLLADPAKPVWRAAAWALRQRGNGALPRSPDMLGGVAAPALKEALLSANPLTRRGAARAFAYQFQGMDGRLDIARTLVPLTADPDLLTRLQALRTLRQWWYRSEDVDFRKLVMRTYLDRMAEPEVPAIRKNLKENLYIILDENHSGGVSIQRNIRDMPPDMVERVLEGRKAVERDILLPPILAALAEGNELQREAVLASFDGSFFKGRSYARNPRDMIDVGNDREFGFLEDPPQALLEKTLGRLLAMERSPALLTTGLELADFFLMPERAEGEAVPAVLLASLERGEGDLRAAAREIVRRDLVLKDRGHTAVEVSRLLRQGGEPDRAALLAALGRSPELAAAAPVREAVSALLSGKEKRGADFLPLVRTGLLNDEEALEALAGAWAELATRPAAERIPVIEALVGRSGLAGAARPPKKALAILRDAASDTQVAVREKTFEALTRLEALRKGPAAAGILYAGLSDESPAIRARSLGFARENSAVWGEEDVHEYVLKLLVDADAKIRASALETVAERHLIKAEPRYAARVKAVAGGDAALKARAEAVLREAGLDPTAVTADAEIASTRLPDPVLFRDRVNPWFYKKGEDKNACADCHATHTILGLAEPHRDGRGLTDDEVLGNYRSILKVINVGDPEQSLVLRKPRSPFGTGQSSDESPTGITHVGGTRWIDGTQNQAYQAILAFARSARAARPAGLAVSVDSYSPEYPPRLAADGNPETLWHTEFVGAMPGYPHELVLELDRARPVAGLTYLPRRDSPNGRVKDFEVYLSDDGKEWGQPAAHGTWPNDALPKVVFLPHGKARFVKLKGLSEVEGRPYMSAAEVEVHFAEERETAAGPAPAARGF